MRRNMLHWAYDTIFIPFRLYYNLNTENVLIQMRYFYTKKINLTVIITTKHKDHSLTLQNVFILIYHILFKVVNNEFRRVPCYCC